MKHCLPNVSMTQSILLYCRSWYCNYGEGSEVPFDFHKELAYIWQKKPSYSISGWEHGIPLKKLKEKLSIKSGNSSNKKPLLGILKFFDLERYKRFIPEAVSVKVPDINQILYNITQDFKNLTNQAIYQIANKKLDYLAYKLGVNRKKGKKNNFRMYYFLYGKSFAFL